MKIGIVIRQISGVGVNTSLEVLSTFLAFLKIIRCFIREKERSVAKEVDDKTPSCSRCVDEVSCRNMNEVPIICN